MLQTDPLPQTDRRLPWLAVNIFVGMVILVAGLWWVQIVTTKKYAASERRQSLRSVRIPAVRGKILDRNGTVLAENHPQYNVHVYFDELRPQFWTQYTNSILPAHRRAYPGQKVTYAIRTELLREASWRVVSNLAWQVSTTLQEPRTLSQPVFLQRFINFPYVPFPIFQNLTPKQVAIFSEQLFTVRGIDLEAKALRVYPYGSTAAHLLGFVREETKIDDDDDINFNYYMPDYIGQMGTESAFDLLANSQAGLRGRAGIKTVLVNSVQYRQREEMSFPTEAGQNVWLTIDLPLQQATERALASVSYNVRGAAVVMDVANGDILALASAPTFDPNIYLRKRTPEEENRLNDEFLRPTFNRASFGGYTPGSIFKIITAIACLESGLDPLEKLYNPGEWKPVPNSRYAIDDTAPAGDYDFERAFKKSSNTYFIHHGLKAGVAKIAEVGKRFHLGELTQIPTRQEVRGDFPSPDQSRTWSLGRTANLCIGQEITVTPLQMAGMTAAIANGGKLFWPRIVTHTEAAAGSLTGTIFYRPGQVREQIQLHPQHLAAIQHAMLADVEIIGEERGSGYLAQLPQFKIAGKTGTAEIMEHGQKDKTTWFTSYGPYENPRYAVVVMVESGRSGGETCAPVARKIYEALSRRLPQAAASSDGTDLPPGRKKPDAFSKSDTEPPFRPGQSPASPANPTLHFAEAD